MTHEEYLEHYESYHEILVDWDLDMTRELAKCSTRDERDKARSQFIVDNEDRFRDMRGLWLKLAVHEQTVEHKHEGLAERACVAHEMLSERLPAAFVSEGTEEVTQK